MAIGRTLWRKVAYSALVALVAASFVVIGILTDEVRDDLGRLESASSDNVQWTLAQAEVEFLEFAAVLASSPSTEEDFTELRRRFDVFYSRVSTLGSGPIYRNLSVVDGYSTAIEIVTSFLDANVTYIDADDGILGSSIPALQIAATDVRPRVRAMSTFGLHHFATQSEQRRNDVSTTLIRLASATAFLVAVLTFFAIYFRAMNRQNVSRRLQVLQTSARMRTIIDTSLDAVIVTDAHGVIVEFNPAAERIFQHNRDDVRGKNIASVIIPDNYRAAHHAGMRRMRNNGTPSVVGKGRITLEATRANGDIFPVELAIQSAHSNDAEIYVAYLRDISQRVHDEQELVAARDRALASEKTKADFLAVMSHEIRTPLNGLIGTLSLLKETPLSTKQNTYLENMSISGRLLMGHVNNVLDITRYEAGTLATTKDYVHLSAVMQEIVDGQAGGAEAAGNTIQWEWIGAPAHWVLTDAARLQHVVLNLVGNAIKFTERGRIAIEVEAHPGKDSMIEIRVSDTGIGIPEDQFDRIFEDFVTQDVAYNRRTNGTGLGLGIAKRIVTAMGGDIGVESVVGEGSTFWICIPAVAVDAPNDSIANETKTAAKKLNPLDVLVVEDNEINRHVVREMLGADGHKVSEAENGQIGVHMAHTHTYDLILMDISMPIMDGRAATQAIRTGNGACRNTTIVALTANVMATEVEQFLADGMNDVLCKPLIPDDLRRVIDSTSQPRLEPIKKRVEVLCQTQNASMKDSIGPEAYATFLGRFVAECEENIDWFNMNAPDANNEAAARAHKLASSAAVFGAFQLRESLLTMENAATDGALKSVHTSTFVAIWNETKNALDVH